MARRLPVLVVTALLLLAPTVAAIPSSEPADAGSTGLASPSATSSSATALQAAETNVTRGLHLDGAVASNVTTAGTDTSSLLDAQAGGLQAQFETYRFEERINSLDSRDAQREVLRQELSNVSDRLDDLRADEREVRLDYMRGEMTGQEFVVALARISAQAEHVDGKLTYIQERFGSSFPSVIRTQLRPLRPEVEAFQGPIRSHSVDVLRDRTLSSRLYVAASENGTRLSMLQGRTWVSQTTRWDNFDRGVHPIGDLEIALNSAMAEAHPEFNFSDSSVTPGFGTPFGTDILPADWSFAYGQTSGFLDGTTGSLFYEEQELFLESLPNTRGERRVGNDTVLTVNRTYAGGPLKVTLTNETGEPLDGEVRIDGELVGSTGFDGELWALDRQGPYNVTVVHEGERIEIEAPTASFDG